MADAAGKISLKKICISTFTIYKSFFILFFRKSYQLAHGSFLLSLDYCTKKAANHLVYNFSRIISCTFKTTYKLKSLLHPFSLTLSYLLGYALDRLVTVSSMHYCTSTSALSTLSSSRGLTTYVGISHLEGGFTLRCLQRLSLPDLATLPCSWRNNRYTSGQSSPVLSY